MWNNYTLEDFSNVPKLKTDIAAVKGLLKRFWLQKNSSILFTISGPSGSGKSTLGAATLRGALACPLVSGFWTHSVDLVNCFMDRSIVFYPYNDLRPAVRYYDLILERGWLVVDDVQLDRISERAFKYFLTKRKQNLLPTVLILAEKNIPNWLKTSLNGEIDLDGISY